MKIVKIYNQLLLSAKIGDAYICRTNKSNSKNFSVTFSSKHKDYLLFKASMLKKHNFKPGGLRSVPSGYKRGSYVFEQYICADERITEIAAMNNFACINNFKKEALIYLYLDDGSLYKTLDINIYCSSLKVEEAEYLSNVINKVYISDKPSKVLIDNIYPYIFINRKQAKLFLNDIKKFVLNNNLEMFYYKINESPSTTIENTNK
jgi:hypothetical protein